MQTRERIELCLRYHNLMLASAKHHRLTEENIDMVESTIAPLRWVLGLNSSPPLSKLTPYHPDQLQPEKNIRKQLSYHRDLRKELVSKGVEGKIMLTVTGVIAILCWVLGYHRDPPRLDAIQGIADDDAAIRIMVGDRYAAIGNGR